jgi:hypothetical protein
VKARALLIALLFGGCGVREEGITVDVTITVTSPLSADLATLAPGSLELVPCTSTRWWSPISTAWAHGDEASTSPWKTTTPVLIDLTKPGPQPVGTLHPPPARLCAVVLTFAPSPLDTRANGTTFLLEGGPFPRELSTLTRTARLEVGDGLVDAEHLHLQLPLSLGATPSGQGDATLEALVSSLTGP